MMLLIKRWEVESGIDEENCTSHLAPATLTSNFAALGKVSEKFPRLRILCLTATWISCRPLRNEFSKRFSYDQIFRTRSHLAFGPEARCRFPRRRWSFQSTQYKGELRWRLNQIWFILRARLVVSIVSILNTFSLYTTLAGMRENLHSCGFPDIYNHTLPSPTPQPPYTYFGSSTNFYLFLKQLSNCIFFFANVFVCQQLRLF